MKSYEDHLNIMIERAAELDVRLEAAAHEAHWGRSRQGIADAHDMIAVGLERLNREYRFLCGALAREHGDNG